jgi:SPP1 gp7 family putative phage head morphogenesis protein
MPDDLYAIARRQRAALIAGDDAALAEISRIYSTVNASVWRELESILAKIDAAQQAGEKVLPSWLYQRDRLRILLNQIQIKLKAAGAEAAPLTAEQQREFARLGELSVVEQASVLQGTAVSLARLPSGAIESFEGFASDGSPLRDLFESIAKDTANTVRDVLVSGIASGRSIAEMTRDLRAVADVSRQRAALIARTETLRAYREAAHQTAQQNKQVLGGWSWQSARDRRTCASCLAMHGSFHDLTERLASHPNCRCTAVYVPRPWLSQPRRVARLAETGEDWLRSQTPEVRRQVLGIAGAEAFDARKVKLANFVHHGVHPRWGETRSQRSLKDALSLPLSAGVGKPLNAAKMALPDVSPLPQPSGTSVSNALRMPGGAMGKKVKRAAGLIDQVHGDGQLPAVPVKQSVSKKEHGHYRWRGFQPVEITVSKHGDHPELTFAHEVGHFIDHQGMSKPGRYASKFSEDLMRGWHEAVTNSPSIKRLKDALKETHIDCRDIFGNTIKVRVASQYVRYLLQTEEIWARSYAQYIAVRSGDKAMLDQVDSIRKSGRTESGLSQWQDDEFEPIARAIDAIFNQLGWRR